MFLQIFMYLFFISIFSCNYVIVLYFCITFHTKNKINLYAKIANILNALTIVDVFEKMIVLQTHFVIILKILIVVEMSKNKAILYANFANISTTIIFLKSICFDFYNYLIFIFDNLLCFDFEITYSIKFKIDIRTEFFVTLIKSTIRMNASIFTTTTTITLTIS